MLIQHSVKSLTVDYDIVSCELGGKVTGGAGGEEGYRCSLQSISTRIPLLRKCANPDVRIDYAQSIGNIDWNRNVVSRPEPNTNGVGGSLHPEPGRRKYQSWNFRVQK